MYQTAVPYIAERISTRAASQAVTFDEFFGDSPRMMDLPSSSQMETSASAVSRLKDRVKRLWHRAIQRWPVVMYTPLMFKFSWFGCYLPSECFILRVSFCQALPVAREVLQLVLRANLMLFYFEGERCYKYM